MDFHCDRLFGHFCSKSAEIARNRYTYGHRIESRGQAIRIFIIFATNRAR